MTKKPYRLGERLALIDSEYNEAVKNIRPDDPQREAQKAYFKLQRRMRRELELWVDRADPPFEPLVIVNSMMCISRDLLMAALRRQHPDDINAAATSLGYYIEDIVRTAKRLRLVE